VLRGAAPLADSERAPAGASCKRLCFTERPMARRWTLFASLVFVSLALVPGGAHLLALPNKIGMSAADYLTAQQAYRGWQFVGVFVVGAIVATAILVYQARRDRTEFISALIALVCVLATQIIFWTLNFPANRVTGNWTTLPVNWESL